jgi:hypothetical protein
MQSVGAGFKRSRWLIFFIPWLLPALVLALQVRVDGIDLRGPWQARWAGGEREIVLPTNFGRQGILERELSLQRTLELSTVEPGAYLLVLGDMRSSVGRLTVNGQVVGDLGAFESTDKADFNGLDAVQVPPGLLKPGRNQLHLELRSTNPRYAGILDRRLVLGPAASLTPWYLRTVRLESWLRAAPLMVFAALGFLLVVLAQLARETRQRRLA